MSFPLHFHPRKSDTLAAVLSQLILWRVEIETAYQAADMESANFEDFMFDLACLIQDQAQASHQPEPETAAQPTQPEGPADVCRWLNEEEPTND